MAQRTHHWRNRITGYGEEDPSQLLANPANWRIHPKGQQDALAGVLSEVGYVQNVIVNQRTGHLVDGHMRVSLALRDEQPAIPVTYIDVDEAEEALILATLDPLAAMAATDAHKLAELLESVSTGDAAVMAMLSQVAESAGVIPPDMFDPNAEWVGMPEFHQDNIEAVKELNVHFGSVDAIEQFGRLIGQKVTTETKSIWFPMRELESIKGKAYVAAD